jgi:hypothetical protein
VEIERKFFKKKNLAQGLTICNCKPLISIKLHPSSSNGTKNNHKRRRRKRRRKIINNIFK